MSSLCIRFDPELPEPNSCKFIFIQFFLYRNNSKVKSCTLLLLLSNFILLQIWCIMEHCYIFYGTNTCSSLNLFRILYLCFSCFFGRNFAVSPDYSTWVMAYFQFPTLRECDQWVSEASRRRVVGHWHFHNLPELELSSELSDLTYGLQFCPFPQTVWPCGTQLSWSNPPKGHQQS